MCPESVSHRDIGSSVICGEACPESVSHTDIGSSVISGEGVLKVYHTETLTALKCVQKV